MKIAVIGFEQGIGKSTLALNLAAALARQGQATLLVDADPEGHLEDLVGLSESGVVLDIKASQFLRATSVDGMHLLSGFGTTLGRPGDHSRTLEKVERLAEEFAAMVFDTGRANGPALLESLKLADVAILAVRDGESAAEGIVEVLRVVVEAQQAKPSLRFGGFLKMRAQGWTAAPSDSALSAINGEFDGAVFDLSIAEDADLARSGEEVLPLVEFAPWGEAGRRMAELAAVLTGTPTADSLATDDAPLGQLHMAETIVSTGVSSSHNVGLSALSTPPPAQTPPPSDNGKPGLFAAMLGWLGRVFGK